MRGLILILGLIAGCSIAGADTGSQDLIGQSAQEFREECASVNSPFETNFRRRIITCAHEAFGLEARYSRNDIVQMVTELYPSTDGAIVYEDLVARFGDAPLGPEAYRRNRVLGACTGYQWPTPEYQVTFLQCEDYAMVSYAPGK